VQNHILTLFRQLKFGAFYEPFFDNYLSSGTILSRFTDFFGSNETAQLTFFAYIANFFWQFGTILWSFMNFFETRTRLTFQIRCFSLLFNTKEYLFNKGLTLLCFIEDINLMTCTQYENTGVLICSDKSYASRTKHLIMKSHSRWPL
jgi:hypothetical protein